MIRRAAKYKRISRDREGLQLGIERQDEDLDRLAERRSLEWAGDYLDNDLSASTHSKKRRPGYEQMLTDARAGKFEVIAAYTTGRITRRPREFEDLIDLAVQCGIEFQYIRSPEFDLSTAQGRRIARMLAAQDAGEAEEIAERVARQKLQAAAAGEYRGGPRPFGYEADGVTVRDSEAVEVLRASELVLRGMSVRSIAADLNARGIPTSTGACWRQVGVRRTLMRARNAGLVEVKRSDGTTEIVGKAQWPAIVPEHVWRGVVAVLGDPRRRTQFSSARRWMGTGIYYCHCGSTVFATSAGLHTSRPKVAYMCRSGKHVARIASELDAHVDALVIARLSQPAATVRLLRRDEVDLAALQVRAAGLRAQMDELALLFAKRTVSASQLEIGTAALRTELDDVDRSLVAATRSSVFVDIVGSPNVAETWGALDLDRRRAVVSMLMTVTLLQSRRGRRRGWKPGESYFDPDSIRIEWRQG